MGGAAGHMAHPFDCREVRNGRDLINFYVKAVNAIPLYEETDFDTDSHSTSLKLDGVNASFRLQPANNSAGFIFVMDRGSKSSTTPEGLLDRAGITPDNSMARFNPDGDRPDHGMIQVVKHLYQMLNHNLEKLKPYVEALGIFDQIGPEGVFFDVEYYTNEDDPDGPNAGRGYQRIGNVVPYNQNFIAIHGMKDFFTEETTSARGKVTNRRQSRGFYWKTNEEINDLLTKKDEFLAQGQDTSEIDRLISEKNKELGVKRREHQDILANFGKALAEHANELDLDFNVHTKIGLQFQEGLSRELILRRVDDALNKELKGYAYKEINEHVSIGPTVINEQTGEVAGRTLKQLLLAVDENPAHIAHYPDQIKKTNKKGVPEPVKGMIIANPEWVAKHGKPKNGKQSPFAKQFHQDVFRDNGEPTGVGAFDLGSDDISGKAINSAVLMWEAVKVIGQVLKEAVVADTDLGVPVGQQEGIVIQSNKICDGIAFKFTGDFITGGQASPYRKDAPEQPLNESKFKYGELLESFVVEAEPVIEQKQSLVILIPGGFKPPTNGHFSMIQQYEKRSDVSKVIVVTGFKPRKEPGLTVTHGQSKAIFDIYGGFGDKVEFRDQGSWPTPMRTCYEYVNDEKFVSEFPGAVFALGASDKGGDKERIKAFYNHFQKKPATTKAKVVNYPPAKAFEVDGKAASATRMRKAFVSGDWETFKKLMPNDSQYDDIVQVLNQQAGGGGGNEMEKGGSMVAENFFSRDPLFSLVDEVLLENKGKPNPWAICNSDVGNEDEKKLQDRVHGVKKQYNIKEDNGENYSSQEDEFEPESEQEEELRQIITNLINKFVEIEGETKKKNIDDEDTKKSLFNTMTSYINEIFDEVVQEEVNEASSAAAGMAGGFAGRMWEEEYE